MTKLRRISVVGFGVLAAGVVVAATAWACSPSGGLSTPANGAELPQGAAGSPVAVRGTGFAANKPVEIVWNSPGNVIARATGPEFTVSVTIPANATMGVHFIGATQGDDVAPGAMSFEVTSTAVPTGPTADSVTGGSGITAATVRGGTGSPAGPLAARPAAPVFAVTAQPGVPASAGPAIATAAQGEKFFGGSLAPAAADPAAQARGARAATGDLWSGFRSGTKSSLPGITDGTPAQGSGPGLAVGMGLLSAGTVALLAGFGVAETRRRRVLVHAH